MCISSCTSVSFSPLRQRQIVRKLFYAAHDDFCPIILRKTSLLLCCCRQLGYPTLRAVDTQPHIQREIIHQAKPKTTQSAHLLFLWYSPAHIYKLSKTFLYVFRNVQISESLSLAAFRIKIWCKIYMTVTVRGTLSSAVHCCNYTYYCHFFLKFSNSAFRLQYTCRTVNKLLACPFLLTFEQALIGQ
jgi:hypothetical protein